MGKNARPRRDPGYPLFAIRYSLISALVAGLSQAALAQEQPAQFVDAATIVPGLIVDMRYAGTHNFVGRRIDGYERPRCLLTGAAAAALAAVARDLAPRDIVLKIFDCYRPTRAVANFVRWARDLGDSAGKAEFYPQVDKRTLFRDGYISPLSGHSRGSTVDLTLARADDGRELDMGTPFDFFSPRSWPADPNVSAEAQANRVLLAGATRQRGFRPYAREWWHFTLRHEPFPGTYFDFPVR
ncbi:MAG: M15 family metallopeptidase [Xanthobacteraceae bacterium]